MNIAAENRNWMIRITGYGTYAFYGSRNEAEAECARKSEWERAQGRIWTTDPKTEVEHLEKEIGEEFEVNGSCPMATLNKLAAARQHASAPKATA